MQERVRTNPLNPITVYNKMQERVRANPLNPITGLLLSVLFVSIGNTAVKSSYTITVRVYLLCGITDCH